MTTLINRIASKTRWPYTVQAFGRHNFATISSGLFPFLPISNPPSAPKALLQGGFLFRGKTKNLITIEGAKGSVSERVPLGERAA
jgi:hypothetical protein